MFPSGPASTSPRFATSRTRLLFLTSVFLTIFYNLAFFRNLLDVYPVSHKNILFLVSLTLLLSSVIFLFLTLVCIRHTTKPVLTLIFLVSSLTSYFMDTYNIFVDDIMIHNILQTDIREAGDLLTLRLFVYLFLLGVIPSAVVWRVRIEHDTILGACRSKVKLFIGVSVVMSVVVFSFGKYYATFFREQKVLRSYTNPTYYLYSAYKYAKHNLTNTPTFVKPIGMDAHIPPSDTERELVIFVLGETARADRFSLNGYRRETNPLLQKEDIINFPNLYACGTSTAVSVPRMFSMYGMEDFSYHNVESTQNILDVLHTAGVNILWRDNNSSSKGVADRVEYEDFKTPQTNPICDVECRDEGMMAGLDNYISKNAKGDILVVLHQMGSHGPAYFKRYPEEFEKFTPVRRTAQLEDCTSEEINNAYDNTILYTDYFLSKVIQFLKPYSDTFETAMIYMSDHGESLGENGIYLHGMPYYLAPDEQRHVPAIIWFGESFKKDLDIEKLKIKARGHYTQDMVFHILLGLMEVETNIYNESRDFFHGEMTHPWRGAP